MAKQQTGGQTFAQTDIQQKHTQKKTDPKERLTVWTGRRRSGEESAQIDRQTIAHTGKIKKETSRTKDKQTDKYKCREVYRHTTVRENLLISAASRIE